MFNSKKGKAAASNMISTIIGNNSKIEGLLLTSDSTRVDGLLQGKILSESSVIIGEHGVIKGDIKAVDILVAGTVYGNIRADSRIEITGTGRVLGDLFTKTLIIDEGASFRGNCSMDLADESGNPNGFVQALSTEEPPVELKSEPEPLPDEKSVPETAPAPEPEREKKSKSSKRHQGDSDDTEESNS